MTRRTTEAASREHAVGGDRMEASIFRGRAA